MKRTQNKQPTKHPNTTAPPLSTQDELLNETCNHCNHSLYMHSMRSTGLNTFCTYKLDAEGGQQRCTCTMFSFKDKRGLYKHPPTPPNTRPRSITENDYAIIAHNALAILKALPNFTDLDVAHAYVLQEVYRYTTEDVEYHTMRVMAIINKRIKE